VRSVREAASAGSDSAFSSASPAKGAASSFIQSLRDGTFLNRSRVEGYPKLLIAIYLLIAAFVIFLGRNPAASHFVIAPDYAKCVAASSLTLQGRAADAYTDASEVRAERAVTGDSEFTFLIWDYPPPFLLFALPTSLVTYKTSLLIWTMLTFAAYLLVLGSIATGWNGWWPIIGFPGVFITMLDGQNGFITLALLAGGLLLLERRPIAAGVLIGLLSYKPQFGILLPLMLAVGGYWKTFLWAAMTVVVLTLVTTALFGVATWQAFIAVLPETNQWLFVKGVGFFKMQSVFGAARLWHASITTAFILQAVTSLTTLGAVWWIWRRPVAMQLKFAALVVGTLLITPYVLDYDLVLLAAPIAWLACEGLKTEFLAWEKSILFLAWLLPLWSRWIGMIYSIPLGPLVLSLMLIAVVRRAMATRIFAAEAEFGPIASSGASWEN
jgi:hypothetical protein